MNSHLKNFLRDIAPGTGTAVLMLFLYPFVMVLLVLACVLAVLPLVFAFGAYVSREYLLVPLWGMACAGVVFSEYKFYKWSASPERTIRGFKEIVALSVAAYLIVSNVYFEGAHSWLVEHSDGGYNPALFLATIPQYIGLALTQPFRSGPLPDIETVFNMLEAFLWSAIGLGCTVYSLYKPVCYRMKLLFFAGFTFFVFGLTDIYEMHTGAWWDPAGLLVVKAGCVLAFIVLYLLYRRDNNTMPAARK